VFVPGCLCCQMVLKMLIDPNDDAKVSRAERSQPLFPIPHTSFIRDMLTLACCFPVCVIKGLWSSRSTGYK